MAAGARLHGCAARSMFGITALVPWGRASPNIDREERSGRTTMNPKDDDLICFYRDAVIAGHDDPAAETMRRFKLSRDYTVRLLNEAIAGCEGQDIRNWARRRGLTNA
jgi:hypothetical protein